MRDSVSENKWRAIVGDRPGLDMYMHIRAHPCMREHTQTHTHTHRASSTLVKVDSVIQSDKWNKSQGTA